jgi:hypothetical protein
MRDKDHSKKWYRRTIYLRSGVCCAPCTERAARTGGVAYFTHRASEFNERLIDVPRIFCGYIEPVILTLT